MVGENHLPHMQSMHIHRIHCLYDNYAWLVVDNNTRSGVVVDPSTEHDVVSALEKHNCTLEQIWITHHHGDHVGGVDGLIQRFGMMPVVCHVSDMHRIPCANTSVDDGTTFEWHGTRVHVHHVPGHTFGAVAYELPMLNALFTGDTLFLGGCGRLFEGTPDMMHASLQKLATLPKERDVYCGHEYTRKNMAFALGVDADNADVASRVLRLSEHNDPTVPGTLAEELCTNPFLRAHDRELQQRYNAQNDVMLFGMLREMRNDF